MPSHKMAHTAKEMWSLDKNVLISNLLSVICTYYICIMCLHKKLYRYLMLRFNIN